MKSLALLLVSLTVALYAQSSTSCWDTLADKVSELADSGYAIAEEDDYNELPNFVIAMRDVCVGCGYNCGFLNDLTSSDVQVIQCVQSLYGVVTDAAEAVSTGGVDVVADASLVYDLYQAVNGCGKGLDSSDESEGSDDEDSDASAESDD